MMARNYHQDINTWIVHMVFDIKLDGFHLKARLVARGHMTEAPTMLNYASIVSHDTVQIALKITVLSDLEVKACKTTFSLCHVRKRYGQCLDLSLEVMQVRRQLLCMHCMDSKVLEVLLANISQIA